MRLVDLYGPVILCLLGIAGLLAAVRLGGRFGWIGYLLGGPLGAAIMLGVICVAVLAWLFFQNLLFRGLPWLPVCRNGRCKGGFLASMGDYKPAWNEDWTLRGFRCRCGAVYQKRGRRFVEIAPDGAVKPYLVWNPWKGWLPDPSEGT